MTFQPSQEPTGDEAIAYLQRCARSIEAHGWGTEEVADFLLHAAYNLHAEAQGAPDMIAWRDRANRRFLFSAGFFRIGVARAPMTPDERAVLDALGFRFCPRLRDFPDRRLACIQPVSRYPELKAVMGGRVRLAETGGIPR